MTGPSQASRRGADTRPADARARGRELALLALCHLESYPRPERAEALALLWANPPRGDDGDEDPRSRLFADLVADAGVRQRAAALVEQLRAHDEEIDAVIASTSERWRLERMAQVDRNVLRLAALELSRHADTPRPVVLAEAVRLARRYGSERSASFVNGVAEALARRLRSGGPAERVEPAEPSPEGGIRDAPPEALGAGDG